MTQIMPGSRGRINTRSGTAAMLFSRAGPFRVDGLAALPSAAGTARLDGSPKPVPCVTRIFSA
jgi:hypothetical protein